ncbi:MULTISPECIES: Cof-type HAD-IIB family hydrolase [unclassified Enterococcus]|uniref:Cof-type HAD-IIB family hydrolase n=1 Tax=unclassified Enterococcus TaxID=2608891 RepID=UPI0015519A84|nr:MULTISPECIES: Cof-type HAD-IIB family hydrolase [unclassified Enterococcus]MBS7576289.1 HAD family phosphatase [Enterococcus sp. MMGLQ5-2]MBS7583522.1 HAD family phosphatase [Enterococcus sp. MMGLQ5-1]NPD11384.1 HAD family phosphatase [Enterococcus sp. MMGLQ5-1]NPD36127.1 HAD family phosphatase [Enterococcus sp. MMGLQ5-2]
MIKLIGIDLDGTLLDDKKTISDRNFQAIAQAKAKGVKVVITTGRPLKAIEHLLEALDLYDDEDFSITFNGGLVQKNQTGDILAKTPMKFEQLEVLNNLTKALGIPLDVISDGTVYQIQGNHQSWYQRANPILSFTPITFEQLDQNLVYNKAISAYDAKILDQSIAKISDFYYEHFEIIKSRDILLEFMPKDVTKASGLAQLADLLNIKQDEVMTIGDEENDLSMIEWAGLGVAMGNAVELIRSASNVTTLDNNHDGVALAIEKYVL